MNFDIINKKNLKTKPSSQIFILSEDNPQKNKISNRQKKTKPFKKNNKTIEKKPVNTYYYKEDEDNKENHDENMANFINRMQSMKKGDKIFGSYKKSNYLNNQYSIERYYKYNKIVNRIKKEDEQLKKNNKLYSSPLQNLDSSESDILYKKQALKALKKEKQSEKKKNKKLNDDTKLSVVRPNSKYTGLNHNNTMYSQTIQYNNDDFRKLDYNYSIPPKTPTYNNTLENNNHNNKNNNKNNNDISSSNKKITNGRPKKKTGVNGNNKRIEDNEIISNKIKDNNIAKEGWKRKNDNKLYNNYSLSSNRNNNNNNNNNNNFPSPISYNNSKQQQIYGNNGNINTNLHINENNDYDEIINHDEIKQNLFMISNKNKNNSPLMETYLLNQKVVVNY